MAIPDLSETLPAPIPLRRTAVISFVWGSEPFHFVCNACSVCRAVDPGSGKEIDWIHFQGAQSGAVNPDTQVRTKICLVPAIYVMRIAYGGRYRISEKRKGDLAIFPPVHPAPDAALPLAQIHSLIAGLQIQGDVAPLLYDNYVRDVSNRFERALADIKPVYNFDHGPEFEVAICKTLMTVLPQKYGVCRGFVVSQLGEKAGDDVIIYDKMRFPTLRGFENDALSPLKEQVPIEAVYAYIEAKNSICIEGDGDNSLQKSLSQVAQVKMMCDRRDSVPVSAKMPGWPEIRNPAYGVIISRHIRLKAHGPNIEDPQEINRHLLAAKAKTVLAPDFCVFGKNNMFIPVIPDDAPNSTFMPSPFFDSDTSRMHASVVDGVAFGAGLSLLLWALDWIQLGQMPWPALLEDCIPPSTTSDSVAKDPHR